MVRKGGREKIHYHDVDSSSSSIITVGIFVCFKLVLMLPCIGASLYILKKDLARSFFFFLQLVCFFFLIIIFTAQNVLLIINIY